MERAVGEKWLCPSTFQWLHSLWSDILWDIRLVSIYRALETRVMGQSMSSKMIPFSATSTHNFLLTFHSNHHPISHRYRDKRRSPSKIANFYSPRWMGSAWNLVSAQGVLNAPMMGLPEDRKNFKIGLVVLIQYVPAVTDSQPASHTPSHVAVAITALAHS